MAPHACRLCRYSLQIYVRNKCLKSCSSPRQGVSTPLCSVLGGSLNAHLHEKFEARVALWQYESMSQCTKRCTSAIGNVYKNINFQQISPRDAQIEERTVKDIAHVSLPGAIADLLMLKVLLALQSSVTAIESHMQPRVAFLKLDEESFSSDGEERLTLKLQPPDATPLIASGRLSPLCFLTYTFAFIGGFIYDCL